MASTTQLTLFVTFTVAASNIDAWKAAHRPVWAACAAEPQLLFFDVFQDPEQPGRFRLMEVWNGTKQWFETEQMTKPYYTTLWEQSEPLWIEPVQIEYYERLGEGSAYSQSLLTDFRRKD